MRTPNVEKALQDQVYMACAYAKGPEDFDLALEIVDSFQGHISKTVYDHLNSFVVRAFMRKESIARA